MSAPERVGPQRAGAERMGSPYSGPLERPHGEDTLFGVPGGRPVAPQPPVESPVGTTVDYFEIRDSAEFEELRRRTLRFVVPAVVLFMANFMVFVLLSAYAPEAMGTPAIGLINVGLLVGVFQFVTTVAVVVIYGRYARARLDPLADRIRDGVEGP